jgi:hypothetical protein
MIIFVRVFLYPVFDVFDGFFGSMRACAKPKLKAKLLQVRRMWHFAYVLDWGV